MFVDFILNGEGTGPVGSLLNNMGVGGVRFDPGLLRPYIDRKGRKCVTVNTGMYRVDEETGRAKPILKKMTVNQVREMGFDHPVYNSVGLRRESWAYIDAAVATAAQLRMRAWDDLEQSNSFGGFDGMSKMTLEYDAMSDPGEAVVDMDGIVDGRQDSPLFTTRSIPLPITHSDFWFSARRLAVARNGGTPLDTTMAAAAGRRVGEMIEKTTIGVEAGIQYGTNSTRHEGLSKVYGYTNHPNRILKTDLTTPTGSNPEAIKDDIIEMREAMYAAGFYGPFVVYHTPAYDRYLDDDYFRSGGTSANTTLRRRIAGTDGIEGIQDVRRLDFWTGSTYQMIMVQMTEEYNRAINGMELTTVQWESQGGLRVNFKVMAIKVPQIRFNWNGNAAVLHATTS